MTAPVEHAPSRGSRREVTALACVLALCALFVLPKFHNAFVFDDVMVVGNDFIHQPDRIAEVFFAHTMVAQGRDAPMPMDTYRPVTLLTFFWDAWLSGHETWSYHLTNLLLHLGVVTCVFALAFRVLAFADVWTAAAVALFFGLSPQLGEAHVWINGRSDPMAALFGLLALLVWDRWNPQPGRASWRPWLAFALMLLGLLSKEVLLFGLPTLVLWPGHRTRSFPDRVRLLVPFASAAVAYLAMRNNALHGLRAARDGDQITRALTNVPVLWVDGVAQLLLPSRLYLRSMVDEYAMLSTVQRTGLTLMVVLLAIGVWASRRQAPVLVWASAWFACTLAPAAMISTVLWPGFGRYLFLPCIGIALALGEALSIVRTTLARRFGEGRPEHRKRSQVLLAVGVSVYLLSLGAGLAVVTADYANNKTLYAAAIVAAPRPAYAYAWLGTHHVESGDPTRGALMLEKATQLDPREPRYLHDLARAHLVRGDSVAAERVLRRGIARAPHGVAGDLRALLVAALAGRDPRAAIAELCTCLAHQPNLRDCLDTPARLLNPLGSRFLELREELSRALTQCPSRDARDALARVMAAPSQRVPVRRANQNLH